VVPTDRGAAGCGSTPRWVVIAWRHDHQHVDARLRLVIEELIIEPDDDAAAIEIRPIRADDKQALREGCDRLSEHSRYRRFLSPHRSLTPDELSYFTELDHHDHEALVAIDAATGHGIGVARYVRSRVDPTVAELAVAVADDWQGHGVGGRLGEALVDRARSEGIERFSALMLADNEPMLNLIRDLGAVHDRHDGQGVVELSVDLPGAGSGDVSRLLRATARGDVQAVGHTAPGMDELLNLDDVDVDGKRVLVRVDLNVPLALEQSGSPARVTDDTRIRAALPTIEELRHRGARLVLVSHLGGPLGHDPQLSMRPVAVRLAELLSAPVTLAPAVVGAEVQRLSERLDPGEILMLENVRYEPGETKNDPELVSSLAALADVYVNDAFGTAHRAHASTEGVAHRLPHAAGRLMEREVSTLSAILEQPTRPLVAILGGAKVSDKIGVIERFLELADVVCIGGAMAFPFLAAQGHPVGASPCAESDLEPARRALVAAADSSCRLELPEDLVIAEHAEPGASGRALDGIDVPEGWIGLDIGARTAEHYAREIASAGTVFWNGPMGRFELDPFTAGTRAIANAVGATSATTVVGGGETVAAIRSFGLAERVSHLSTAGGATLELLEGRELPGVHVLLRPAQAHVAR
jgi:phosphoglycerate kinase